MGLVEKGLHLFTLEPVDFLVRGHHDQTLAVGGVITWSSFILQEGDGDRICSVFLSFCIQQTPDKYCWI